MVFCVFLGLLAYIDELSHLIIPFPVRSLPCLLQG